MFAKRIDQVKKTEIQLQILSFVICLPDAYGNYTSI